MAYQRIFVTFGVLFSCLFVWTADAAPTQSRQEVDTHRLALLLQQIDQKLDMLLARLGTARVSTRNEDGNIPYKRNEDGNIPYKRNEDGDIPYLKERNEDGDIPYAARAVKDPQIEDGSIPYATNPTSSKAQTSNGRDVSLREVLRFLMEMERKNNPAKRDHDIPFPS